MVKKIKRVYCHQFGGWWSFSTAQFQIMCEKWLQGENVDLGDCGKMLRGIPYHNVGSQWFDNDDEGLSVEYFGKTGYRVFHTVDWDLESVRYALSEFNPTNTAQSER